MTPDENDANLSLTATSPVSSEGSIAHPSGHDSYRLHKMLSPRKGWVYRALDIAADYKEAVYFHRRDKGEDHPETLCLTLKLSPFYMVSPNVASLG